MPITARAVPRGITALVLTAVVLSSVLVACGNGDTARSDVIDGEPRTGTSIPAAAGQRNPGNYARYGLYERLDFGAGEVGMSLTGAVVPGTANGYVLAASGGQSMTVTLNSVEGDASLEIYAPDDTRMLAGASEATVRLPDDGDYLLVISSERGNATYELAATIE